MDVYARIAEKIIERQEAIIGPVAIEQAGRVVQLHVDWKAHQVTVDGDGKVAIDQLIDIYKHLFGQISVEVSKEAARSFVGSLAPEQLPKSLQ